MARFRVVDSCILSMRSETAFSCCPELQYFIDVSAGTSSSCRRLNFTQTLRPCILASSEPVVFYQYSLGHIFALLTRMICLRSPRQQGHVVRSCVLPVLAWARVQVADPCIVSMLSEAALSCCPTLLYFMSLRTPPRVADTCNLSRLWEAAFSRCLNLLFATCVCKDTFSHCRRLYFVHALSARSLSLPEAVLCYRCS